MRQGQQNRRGRGRNRKGQSPLSRNFESSGPDVKIRGSAAHIAEKYMTLARDAMSSGDPIMAENYLQHAEHYNRIIMAAQTQNQQPFDPMNANGMRPRPVPGDMVAGDSGDDLDGDDQTPPRESFGQVGQREQHGYRDQQHARFDRSNDMQRQPPGLDDQPMINPAAPEAEAASPPADQEDERSRTSRGPGGDAGFRRGRQEGEEGFRSQRRRGRNGAHGERRHNGEPRERPVSGKPEPDDTSQT